MSGPFDMQTCGPLNCKCYGPIPCKRVVPLTCKSVVPCLCKWGGPVNCNQPCTRPKIELKVAQAFKDNSTYLRFDYHGSSKPMEFWIQNLLPRGEHIEIVGYPFTEYIIHRTGKKKQLGKSSLLFQSLTSSIIPKDIPPSVYSYLCPEIENNEYLERTNLEVLYVGKSYGKKGSSSALKRLKKHEHLQTIYHNIINSAPHLEIWLILLPFDKQKQFSFLDANQNGNDSDILEFINSTSNPVFLREEIRINFTEAALINYFKPKYNVTYKYNFPMDSHKSYNECFEMPIDGVIFELQTHESIFCRLFSKTQKPSFFHYKNFLLRTNVEKKHFFEGTF